ncbi:MAG: cupredoxin domain-containing protein [Actinomycetota bacterium]|nr:cupredoxin domain-containing protein [Actinomycetota bacterium]
MSRLIAVVAVVTMLAGGCANNRESAQARAPRDTGTATARIGPDGVQEVAIVGTEQFRFVPSTVRAKAGKLRILLTNSGTTPHDLQIEGLPATTGLIGGGEKGRITVTLKPGSYSFVCTLHTRLHMMGTIVVS